VAQYVARRFPQVDREDLLGAAYWGFLRGQRTYDPARSVPLEAFLWITSLHDCLKEATLLERWRRELWGNESRIEEIDPDPTPQERAEVSSVVRAVCRVLVQLPPREREIIQQRYFSGEDPPNFRVLSGYKSRQAAKMREIRALRKLRKLLEIEEKEKQDA
jgi:RNA polymerase sigma factor (sigma-70 family)